MSLQKPHLSARFIFGTATGPAKQSLKKSGGPRSEKHFWFLWTLPRIAVHRFTYRGTSLNSGQSQRSKVLGARDTVVSSRVPD